MKPLPALPALGILPATVFAVMLVGFAAGPAAAAEPALGPIPAPDLAAPAATPAPPPATPPTSNLNGRNFNEILQSMKDYLGPEDTDLLMAYIRDSTLAWLGQGQEPALTPDLAFKVEILQARMKREGAWYLQGLQKRLEEELEAYRNPPPPQTPLYVPSYPQIWLISPQNSPKNGAPAAPR